MDILLRVQLLFASVQIFKCFKCECKASNFFGQNCVSYLDIGQAPPLSATGGSNDSRWKGLSIFSISLRINYKTAQQDGWSSLSTMLEVLQVTCTLIPGDGVGPEVSDAVQTVLQACCIFIFHPTSFSLVDWQPCVLQHSKAKCQFLDWSTYIPFDSAMTYSRFMSGYGGKDWFWGDVLLWGAARPFDMSTTIWISLPLQINHHASRSIEDVVASVKKNRVCLKVLKS